MNNATKEVDKNNSKDHKKTSDDNSSSERRDNKRRDSVTGSVLDTGSSSNSSSADSDELELLDSSCESKKIMATTLTEEQSAISESSNSRAQHWDRKECVQLNELEKSKIRENKCASMMTYGMVKFQYQQAQEKATRDRLEKASVVQNLLSLRITDSQSVAQKRSHQQQQQQQQQSVPISFGDFNEENRVCPSQSQSTGNNNTFTTFSGMNTFNENELIQVYSTGNKLHGLFRCDDSSTNAPSKVQLSLDNTSSYNHMDNGNGGEDNSDSLANKDGLEMENVLKMVDDSNKGVIHQFYNEKQHTTVLHQLAATRNINKPCSVRDHGSCRMIRLILDMLSWKDMRSTMRERTTRTGKTAMHLAASTGQSCQLDALMSYVANNNVHLVKMLLWYGADLSLMERQCTPLQLASLNPCTLEVCFSISALDK
ncbi:unnamed protein product [Anisakis simplex]|uniref:ANK_REP_REGION domain-containing protein n=1 Tax=Anisakis simplex TaxID=6269 RepID=A0A0M3KAY1_ANISI|nr:unnamed protein product [Anisakis simplex]